MLTKAYTDLTTTVEFRGSEQSDQRLGWGEHLAVLIPILVIYFVLAFYHIGHQSLWVDEIRSLESASADGSFFSPSIWQRGQGPLYFAFLHLWGLLSTSEAVVRALSALFGGLGVCLIYLLGVNLFNRRVAQIGAIIFATSPFLIWYSQEIRYITLAITTSLLATYTFRQALFANRYGWWLSYSCSLILAMGALVTNIFVLAFHGLYVLRPKSRHLLTPWLMSQLLVFVLLTGWANGGHLWELGGWYKKLYLEMTVKDKSNLDPDSERLWSGGRREFTTAALPYTFFAFSTGFSLGPSLEELHNSTSLKTLLPHAPIISACAVLFVALSLLGTMRLWRYPNERLFLGLWLAVPVIGALSISAVTAMSYNVRYVSASLPAYVLILALGIAGCRRTVQIMLLIAVLFVNGYSLGNYYFDPRYARADARSAALYLQSAVRPHDIILIVGNAGPLQYYYKGDSRIVPFQREIDDNISLHQNLREISKGHDLLWLVEHRAWEADPEGKVKAAVEALARAGESKIFPGVEIYSYQLPRLGS